MDIDGCEARAGEGVVEVDCSIVGAAACGDETSLPGAERDGLDGGAV